jgi:DNA-binding NarL/FixJ family response regulator
MHTLRILIVEDDAIVAEDISDFLKDLGHIPVGPAYDLEAAEELIQKQKFDIALLDIHLRNPDDGINLAKWIKEKKPVPVIFLTAYSDSMTLSKVKEIHPEQYLVKPFNSAQLKAAIEITANNFYNPNPQLEINTKVLKLNQHLSTPLTQREIDILVLVNAGRSNREIAEKLFVSENTVKTHLKNIFIKTNSNSRTDLLTKINY